MRKIFLLIFIALFSCGLSSNEDNIVGKWKGQQTEDGIMFFHENGMFDMLDSDGKSAFFNNNEPTPIITWEIITEVEPHQLYITMEFSDKTEHFPLGIFKIKKNKLILRQTIVYHRYLGGFDMGVSKYEMPKDFSGILKVFERIN